MDLNPADEKINLSPGEVADDAEVVEVTTTEARRSWTPCVRVSSGAGGKKQRKTEVDRMMKSVLGVVLFASVLMLFSTLQAQELKPRIVVLTDIAPNDVKPDDMESTIRLLAHADLFEIETLVARPHHSDPRTAPLPPSWPRARKANS